MIFILGNQVKNNCPKSGAVYGDKGYYTKKAVESIKSKTCHAAPIKKKNMKGKNKYLDNCYREIRFPYERVFSKIRRRVKYVGISKNQFSEFLYALSHNIKRLSTGFTTIGNMVKGRSMPKNQ